MWNVKYIDPRVSCLKNFTALEQSKEHDAVTALLKDAADAQLAAEKAASVDINSAFAATTAAGTDTKDTPVMPTVLMMAVQFLIEKGLTDEKATDIVKKRAERDIIMPLFPTTFWDDAAAFTNINRVKRALRHFNREVIRILQESSNTADHNNHTRYVIDDLNAETGKLFVDDLPADIRARIEQRQRRSSPHPTPGQNG
jgi:hypothetical protein